MRITRVVALVSLVAALALTVSCNKRVFQEVLQSCEVVIAADVPVPVNKAADILIVVDNSGSMSEEQQNLAENFVQTDPNKCPLQDLNNIDQSFKNPTRDKYTCDDDGSNCGPLAGCGFIQLLAAFDSDFRVGVITTDVGLCDNRLPGQQAAACFIPQGQTNGTCAIGGAPCSNTSPCNNDWGFRPQRGCLQPNGPPGTDLKVIAAADLKSDDAATRDLATRFNDTLANIQTFGSPYERGLDAAAIFLGQEPGATPNPDCAGDLDTFRRSDAALVVIFLSDEEDCSHGLGDSTFPDELSGEVCGEFQDIVTAHSPGSCYSNDNGVEGPAANLTPVANYVKALQKADANVKVAVIAGGVGAPGDVTAEGCHIVNGHPQGGDCRDSGGLSNFTGQGEPCDPSAGEACCTADPGSRYFDLANTIGKKTTDSICNASFGSTMLNIAAFIAAVDFVELAEPPANPNAIIVELTKAGGGEPTVIKPVASKADCATQDGWFLESATRVDLCGAARPGPGDTISIRAEGAAANSCK